MLHHVLVADGAKSVLGGMNELARVVHGSLDDEGRGIAGLGGTSMVGASVATLGLDKGDGAVLCRGSVFGFIACVFFMRHDLRLG